MLRRLALTVLLTGAAGFAVVALIVVPAVLVAALLLGALAGVLRFTVVVGTAEPAPPQRRRGAIAGITAAAAVGAATLVVAGIAVIFGAATPPVLVLAGIASGPWWWARLRPYTDRYLTRHRPVGPAAVEPDLPGAPPSAPERREDPAWLSTTALCARWQASYHAVIATDDPATCDGIAAQRRDLLDELARRDPDGVAAWLATESRPAATSPHRYLTGPCTTWSFGPGPDSGRAAPPGTAPAPRPGSASADPDPKDPC